MNRPRKGIARGINWILERAGADFEAVQDERGTGQFEGTTKAEVVRAFNYLERLIRDAK